MSGAGARAPLLLAVALAGACGRVGPPVEPERTLPLPPAALTATVRAGEITLTWLNPTHRADRTRLRDLAVLRVYRTEDGGQGEARPAVLYGGEVIGYTRLAAIRLERPEPAVVEGRQVRFVDRADLTDGRRYTYVVTAADGIGRTSPPSRRLSVLYITATEPPAALGAQAGEGMVALRWTPPEHLVDGRPVAGAITYEVLRAASPDAIPGPITPTPIAATGFTDTNVANDHTYYYAVRAVRAAEGGTAISAAAPKIAATPRDVTPPSPPTELAAIPSADAIRLTWNRSPEPDVAGYIVYRAAGPGAAFIRIGTTSAATTVFVDRGLARGTYRYAVGAFDTAATPNESPRSPEVSVTLP
jgi:uncharacterized protein